MLFKAHDYLWCLVMKKPKRSLVLQYRVGHTTSSNERNQLAMEKEKRKKNCLTKLIRKKTREEWESSFFKITKKNHFKYMLSKHMATYGVW